MPRELNLFDRKSQRTVAIGRDSEKRKPIRIMLCGPTLYDHLHVGHARMLLTYDLVARLLRLGGHSVELVVNLTDIDTKIFQKSLAEDLPPASIAQRYFRELQRDLPLIGIAGFTFAMVSDYAKHAEQLAIGLLRADLAYFSTGRFYLRTGLDPGLGTIAHLSREEIEDCRLDIAESKHSASDILIWSNDEDSPTLGTPDAEVGSGIPWWHMQDTSVAMANYAGLYDIHGGAGELAYPHHESHRAQLSSITERPSPVKAWTYVGLVTVARGLKMSKSLGNVVKLTDAVAASSANALRLFCFSRSYSQPLKFSWAALQKLESKDREILGSILKITQGIASAKSNMDLMARFLDCLCNDLDTVSALQIFDLALSESDRSSLEMARILGLRY